MSLMKLHTEEEVSWLLELGKCSGIDAKDIP
jgi:hypothetical protein